jgi:hypothetical protein
MLITLLLLLSTLFPQTTYRRPPLQTGYPPELRTRACLDGVTEIAAVVERPRDGKGAFIMDRHDEGRLYRWTGTEWRYVPRGPHTLQMGKYPSV